MMKKIRKHQKAIPFLLALLLIFSVFVPSSFAQSYTMDIFNRMNGVPANKVFHIKFNDVPDVNSILQTKGVRIVDPQYVLQDITFSLDPSNNRILQVHPPQNGYIPGGEYTLNLYYYSLKTIAKSIFYSIETF